MNEPEVQPQDVSPASQKLERWVVAVLIVFIGFGITYAWIEHRSAEEMASSRDQMRAELNQTRSQLEALNTKVTAERNAAQSAAIATPKAAEEETPAPHVRATSNTHVAPQARVHRRAVRPAVEDPRWKQVQGQLADQQKQIADSQRQIQEEQDNLRQARSELEGNIGSTRDELNGTIAKNHDELVALERKGERNFYEFDLKKAKTFRSEGPISISVRKTNTKHEFCDLAVVVNDNELSKKHLNIYEPVLFYPEGYSAPLELVINRIEKDSVHGYVSEPKYKPQAPTTAANMNSAPASTAASAAAAPSSPAETTTSQVNLQHRSGDPQ